MALRKFTDRSGCVWNVWNVQPTVSELSLEESLRQGWLCFQRLEGGERFRLPLSDAPAAWEELPTERLDLLRRVARLSPTTGPMRRVEPPSGSQEDDARA